MHKFVAADRQREQLADLFKRVLGHPVRIEVEQVSTASAAANTSSAPANSSPGAAPSSQELRSDREEAMALPLVKEVQAVFEVTLIETHMEAQVVASNASDQTETDSAAKPIAYDAQESADDQLFDDLMNPSED